MNDLIGLPHITRYVREELCIVALAWRSINVSMHVRESYGPHYISYESNITLGTRAQSHL